MDGDRLVVGAVGEDSGATGVNGNQIDTSQVDSDAAYVFERDATGSWSQIAYLKASDTRAGDVFGRVGVGADTGCDRRNRGRQRGDGSEWRPKRQQSTTMMSTPAPSLYSISPATELRLRPPASKRRTPMQATCFSPRPHQHTMTRCELGARLRGIRPTQSVDESR